MLLRIVTVSLLTVSTACAVDADLGSTESHVKGRVAFTGPGHNWFNPSNWSTRQVPGPTDSIELDGNDDVVIPAGKVTFQDLHVRDDASLEVLGGAIVESRDHYLHDGGQIIFRGSGDLGRDTFVDSDCTNCGLKLNPNPKSKRVVVLQLPFVETDFGLGGTIASSLTHDATGELQLAAGPGHYSTITAESVTLAGNLELSLYYGFEPSPGDTFQIVTVTGRRTGEFADLPEGAVAACNDTNVCLRISYRGGDGNDVVLTAEQHTSAPTNRRVHKPLVVTKELDQ